MTKNKIHTVSEKIIIFSLQQAFVGRVFILKIEIDVDCTIFDAGLAAETY